MDTIKPWVALLDADEDDYIFWQHGFSSWAQHLELYWFTSVSAFISATSLGKDTPVALVIDGVIPDGEEMKWLSTLLLHPSCQRACLIMLSAEVEDQQREAYLLLGAADHIQKPSSLHELEATVLQVSAHVAARSNN